MTKFERKFVLKHVFSNISEMKEDEAMYSGTETHFGIPWRYSVMRAKDHLATYLHCENRIDGNWTVETEYSLEIISATKKSHKISFDCSFGKEKTSWGRGKFLSWTEMEKSYVEDNKILMKCHVAIKNVSGIAKKRLRNFAESMGDLSDVVLKIGEERFHVSRIILANYSSYFKSLFFGKFDEERKPEFRKPEIELNGIDAKGFQDFLETIYGDPAVNDDNVEGVLKLAEKFNSPMVSKKCEEYLLSSSEMSIKKKLRLSSQFILENLLNSILDAQKTVKDVVDLLPLDLTVLNPVVTRELLQKVAELAHSQ